MNILQIGVCDGNDHVSNLIKQNYKYINKITFVDANPDSINLLSNNYKNNFNSIYEKFNFINAAVVDSSYDKEFIKFYKPSKYQFTGYESLIKDHVLQHLLLEKRDPSITEYDVKAININKLLESDIFYDRLYLDVEGYDCKIIQSIDFEKIYIPYILFEHRHSDGCFTNSKIFKDTIDILSKNLYKVYQYDEYNLICIK